MSVSQPQNNDEEIRKKEAEDGRKTEGINALIGYERQTKAHEH